MATSTPQTTLEDIVTCTICMERMKNPKHLQCQHAFCEECLKTWITQPGNTKRTITCPMCRHVTAVRKGIHMLPTDIGVTRLLDMLSQQKQSGLTVLVCGKDGRAAVAFCESCSYHICQSCVDEHVQNQKLWPHLLYLDDVCCTQHAGAVQDLYCQQCDRLGCRQCMTEKHKKHITTKLADIAETNRESMRYLLDSLQDIMNAAEEKTDITKVAKLESRVQELTQRINEHANKNHTAVDVWQKSILGTLKRRSKTLVKEVFNAESQMEDCSSLVSFISRLLEEGSDYQLVTAFSATSHRLHQATDSLHTLARGRRMGLNFVENPVPRNCGVLVTANSSNQQSNETNVRNSSTRGTTQTSFSNSSTQMVDVSESSHTLRKSFCSSSTQTTEFLDSMLSPSTGRTSDYQSTTHEQSVPETIDFDALRWHDIGIVLAKALHVGPDQERSHRVKGFTQWLRGTKDEDLEPLVTVSVCHEDGVLYYTVAGWWTGGKLFMGGGPWTTRMYEKVMNIFDPRCIAVSPVDVIVAVSEHNPKNSIIVLEGRNRYSHHLPTIKHPYGISITHNNQWIIVDKQSCSVGIYMYVDHTLSLLCSFGSRGNRPGQFEAPTYVCHDPIRNRVIVSDTGNNRIQVFSMSGDYLWEADASDSGRVMRRPRGLCLDGEGNILVADTGNYRIAVLDRNGGEWGRGIGLDFMPHSVSVKNFGPFVALVHVAGLKGKMPIMKVIEFCLESGHESSVSDLISLMT